MTGQGFAWQSVWLLGGQLQCKLGCTRYEYSIKCKEAEGWLWGWQVGGMVELPELRVAKKVKSMQVFRRPVLSCRQGDRAGICVTQLNAASLERTLLCAPGSVPTFTAAIAAVEKVRFFSGALPSKSKVRCPPSARL